MAVAQHTNVREDGDMVRRIQIILVVICLVLLFLLSLVFVLQMIPWSPVSDFGIRVAETISANVRFLIFLAASVLVLAIGVLQLRELRETILITKDGEEGRVTIVESAITRYIKQVASDIDSVQNVRPRITSTPRGLVIDLFAKVVVTDTLPRIEQTIRACVREALEQTLGVGGVAAINVVIEGFQKVGPRTGSAVAAEAKPVAEPTEAAVGGESASISWGRLPHRSEAKEESKPEGEKSDQVKVDDVQSGSQPEASESGRGETSG
jgi:uncharacterized alkaline shock family protein YloU